MLHQYDDEEPAVEVNHVYSVPVNEVNCCSSSNSNAHSRRDITQRQPSSSSSSRHRSSAVISCFAYNAENSKLYVGLENGEVRFWQLRSQSPGPGPLLLGSHKGAVAAICVPPDTEGELGKAKLVLTGSQDATIKIWDYKGKILQEPSICVQTLHGHGGSVTALVVSGNYILSGSTDCSIRVWKAVEGREALCYPWFEYMATVMNTEGWVRCMSLGRGRKRMSSEAESVFIGDDAGGLMRIDVHGVIRPDTRLVGSEKEFRVKGRATASNGTPLAVRKLHDRGILAVRHVPDERMVITLAYDNTVRVYDMAAGVLKHSWANENGCLFTAVEFDAVHQQVLTGDQAGFLAMYDLRRGALVATKRLSQGALVGLAWALAPNTLVALTGSEVQIWRIDRDLDYDLVRGGHTRDVICIVTCTGPTLDSPVHDYRIFSAGLDNTVRLWDPYNMACLQVVEDSQSELSCMAFSQMHNLLVTGHDDGAVKLWDLDTHQPITFRHHTNTVAAIALGAVRPGEELLVTAGFDGWLCLWDLRTNRTQQPSLLDKMQVFQGAVGGSDGSKTTSNPVTQAQLPPQLRCRREVLCLLYDPLKKAIITGGNDNRIWVWSLVSKSALGSHVGHTDAVTCMALDANLVISGSEDCTLRVWDSVPGGTTAVNACHEQVFVGKPLQTMTGHTQPVTGVAVLPSSGRVVSCSLDGRIMFWDYLRGISLHKFEHDWQFRCLALRHDMPEVLAGTADGRLVRVSTELPELGNSDGSPTPQELHSWEHDSALVAQQASRLVSQLASSIRPRESLLATGPASR